MNHVANSSIPPSWMGYRSIAVLPSPPPSSIFIHLAPDVPKVDNTIHCMDNAILVIIILICWTVIYPVDSAIQRFNSPGQVEERQTGARFLVQVSKGWGRKTADVSDHLVGRWQIRILEKRGQKQRQYCFNLLVYLVNLLDK